MADAIVPRGFKPHHLSKLSPEAVADMRRRWAPKGRGGYHKAHTGDSISSLAREYGVNYYTAWCAINRDTHVRVRA